MTATLLGLKMGSREERESIGASGSAVFLAKNSMDNTTRAGVLTSGQRRKGGGGKTRAWGLRLVRNTNFALKLIFDRYSVLIYY
jgi:hypothetical protein